MQALSLRPSSPGLACANQAIDTDTESTRVLAELGSSTILGDNPSDGDYGQDLAVQRIAALNAIRRNQYEHDLLVCTLLGHGFGSFPWN